MKKIKRNQLEEIVVSQNNKIKKLNDQLNAVRSQNVALKALLQKPGFDASWFDNTLRRVERELKSLRDIVDIKKKDHQEVVNIIKAIEIKEEEK